MEDQTEASSSKPESLKALGEEVIGLESDEEETAAERKARKALKKQRKREAKAVRKAERQRAGKEEEEDEDEEDEEEEEEPFDYSQAQSILNAKRENKHIAGRGKVFNPYSSLTAEGPKPARRMHGEKPGKSATFKTL